MKKNDFKISLNGLPVGESTLMASADREFFVSFENYEVLDAALKLTLVADRKTDRVDMQLTISGTVTVPCDRCNKPVKLNVESSSQLCLRLNKEALLGDDAEEVFFIEGTDELDLAQEVYDFSLLALPFVKVHEEGECDEEVLRYLSTDDGNQPEAKEQPFSQLADLLNKKNKNL